MNSQDIADKVKNSPEAVKNCATVDNIFYDEKTGVCGLGKAYSCPFQSKKNYVTIGNEQLPWCLLYRAKFKFGK